MSADTPSPNRNASSLSYSPGQPQLQIAARHRSSVPSSPGHIRVRSVRVSSRVLSRPHAEAERLLSHIPSEKRRHGLEADKPLGHGTPASRPPQEPVRPPDICHFLIPPWLDTGDLQWRSVVWDLVPRCHSLHGEPLNPCRCTPERAGFRSAPALNAFFPCSPRLSCDGTPPSARPQFLLLPSNRELGCALPRRPPSGRRVRVPEHRRTNTFLSAKPEACSSQTKDDHIRFPNKWHVLNWGG